MLKPMLSATLERLEDVKFPVYVQPKLDGIRCLIVNGVAVSRNLKPIPNLYIQACLKGLPDGLDGELMVDGDFNDVQSRVMRIAGEPKFTYEIFDIVSDVNYSDRLEMLMDVILNYAPKHPILIVPAKYVEAMERLVKLEAMYVAANYEGIMIRSIDSPYKFGRSTLQEQYLMKFKRFKDSEATVIGIEPLSKNTNEKTKDALGHGVRSSHKAGMVQQETLGSLWCHDEKLGIEFNVGSGFTMEEREEIWKNRSKYMGKVITYKYQELSSKSVPRFPTFLHFREAI